MSTNEKTTPEDTGYYRYEVIGDCTLRTSAVGTVKTVQCRRVPVRGIALTVGVFFDGTGNNRANSDDLRLAYAHCANLVGEDRARACEKYEKHARAELGNASWQGGITNISRLFDLYQSSDELNDSETEAQVKIYVSGIGTADGESDSMLGAALGSSLIRQFEGVVTKTDEALDKISAELSRFIKLNRDKVAIAKVQFDVFGFSRGAAAARHFANRVMNQDAEIAVAIDKGLDLTGHHGKAAGEVRFLALFDTVAAIGSLLNFYGINGRSNPGVNLELRPSVAQKVFQISAMHECRYNFSLNSIAGMWPELALPGAHSDIGGGYNAGEDEISLLTMPDFEVIPESSDEMQTAVYRKAEKMRQTLYSLPALKYLMPHGKVETKMISWPLVNRDKARAFILEKKAGAAVFMTRRAVPNDWEKVSMRVMLDAAQDAGVIFGDIDPQNTDMALPAELVSLCDKAIAQGRAVRRGTDQESFTADEMRTIGRYLHCSANWNIDSDLSLWVSPSSGEVFLRNHYAPTDERSFVWPMAPGKGWVRTVWRMDDQQQWEDRARANADALDRLF
ncbi:T6SS phospholipase effector Tle1-like catalytic domain-containing protein [Enterobacter asburiae]|uniref:T6SS phospholipase effector Tle1-like catalytic domain-containing protein n=1 Tax=Enterobacter asburiae TaxID=61645 RepID=UPI0032B5B6CC